MGSECVTTAMDADSWASASGYTPLQFGGLACQVMSTAKSALSVVDVRACARGCMLNGAATKSCACA